MSFTVHVDSNFRSMDRPERYTLGEFATRDEALAAAQRVVDTCLADVLEPGMTPEDLFVKYTLVGDDPFIVGDPDLQFSAWDYAKARAEGLCTR